MHIAPEDFQGLPPLLGPARIPHPDRSSELGELIPPPNPEPEPEPEPPPVIRYYSPSSGGFYGSDVHKPEQIPGDAVEITTQLWAQLLRDNAEGMVIEFDEATQQPISVWPPLTVETVRRSRDSKLRRTDWTQLPDVPLVLRLRYAVYRQQLRDFPAHLPPVLGRAIDLDKLPWPTPPA